MNRSYSLGCDRLKNGAGGHPNPNPWDLCMLTSQKRLCRCDKVKDLEQGRLPCIIWVDSKYNHKCSYRKGRGRFERRRQCGHEAGIKKMLLYRAISQGKRQPSEGEGSVERE